MQSYQIFPIIPFLLCACGGGVTSEATTPPAGTSPFSQSASDTVQSRLVQIEETELTTRTTTLRNDLNSPSVTNNGMKTAKVTLSQTSNGLTLTAFGQTKTFTDANLNPDLASEYVIVDGQKNTYLWTFEADWQTVKDGRATSTYLIPFGTSTYDADTGLNMRGYGVVGLETPSVALDGRASATYSGQMIADSYVDDNPGDIFQMYGRVTLEADFGSRRIDGRIDNLIVGDIDQTSEFIIQPANISGNGYATSIGYDPATCANCGTITGSNIEGRFYGNAAQETGGTITFEGISQEGYTYVAAGVIEASR